MLSDTIKPRRDDPAGVFPSNIRLTPSVSLCLRITAVKMPLSDPCRKFTDRLQHIVCTRVQKSLPRLSAGFRTVRQRKRFKFRLRQPQHAAAFHHTKRQHASLLSFADIRYRIAHFDMRSHLLLQKRRESVLDNIYGELPQNLSMDTKIPIHYQKY